MNCPSAFLPAIANPGFRVQQFLMQKSGNKTPEKGARLYLAAAPGRPVSGFGGSFSLAIESPDKIIVPEEEIDESLDQPWHVIVYDDPVNLMSYVTMVLQRIFGYPTGTAERMMMEVHTRGKSVVWTGGRERAEHYVQLLHSSQLLADMKKAG
jgi:ATP-dependent Clp protease adaptor protein ClpS